MNYPVLKGQGIPCGASSFVPTCRDKIKSMAEVPSEEGKLIGEVTHYFGKIGVAVIKLKGPLKEGDTIRIIGGEATDFKQEVQSMEMEHKKIKVAKAKQSIGLKVKEKVREGYQVYKL